MKPYYKSTTIWLGLGAALYAAIPLFVELLNYVGEYDFAEQPVNWWLLAAGITSIIQRWRTDQPITSIAKPFDRLRKRISENETANRYRNV